MSALTHAQKEQYERDGYLVLRGYLDTHTVEELSQAAQEVVGRVGPLEPANPRIQVDLIQGHYYIRQVWPVIDLSEAFARLAQDERLLGLFRTLFDDTPVLFEDKLNYKYPHGSSPFLLHQDLTYWEGFSPRLTSALIYIDEATEENGCLEVVPGRHKEGVLTKQMGQAGLITEHQIVEESVDPALAVKVPGPPGTLILFSCTTPHASEANRSEKPRRVVIFTYNPAADGSGYEATGGANRERANAWLAAQKTSRGEGA
jgi:2-aminoethylphosphonate dioxygenase